MRIARREALAAGARLAAEEGRDGGKDGRPQGAPRLRAGPLVAGEKPPALFRGEAYLAAGRVERWKGQAFEEIDKKQRLCALRLPPTLVVSRAI